MRPVYDSTVTREDGSDLKKYKLSGAEPTGSAAWLAMTFVLGNMFLLLKNVLFSGGDETLRAAPLASSSEGRKGEGLKREETTRNESDKPEAESAHSDEAPIEAVSLRRWMPRGSSTSIDLIEDEVRSARIPGVTYSSGTSLIAGNDNNVIFAITTEVSLIGLIPAGSGQGGGGGVAETDDDGDDEDGDEDDVKNPPRLNRLPVVTAPISFDNILANQSVVLLLSDLLRNAHDPDGDALKVVGLVGSKGSVVEIKPGVFVFTPDPTTVGTTTFKYHISDGTNAVLQTATVTVVEPKGKTLIGTPTSEVILGTIENDVVDALAGNDDVIGLSGDDIIFGREGNDRILGGEGDDVIYGGDGNDVIFAGAGDDVVSGGKGQDVILGEDGADTLFGDEDDDTISGGNDNDTIDGGSGADALQGDDGDDLIFGADGDDAIEGGTGDDILIGGAGQDQIEAGAGDDRIEGDEGSDTGFGDGGDDIFVATERDGDDTYDGGEGTDTYDVSATVANSSIDLNLGSATSDEIGEDRLRRIENILGGHGNDSISGDEAANRLDGGAGDDALHGAMGSDQLEGGAGDDVLSGDGGEDVVAGGLGNDRIVATTGDGNDQYDGGDGQDTYDVSTISADVYIDLARETASSVETGEDELKSIENVVGGQGSDVIIASDAVNVLAGGTGEDLFVFRTTASAGKGPGSRDRILDFEVGDKIDLNDISREFQDLANAFEDEGIKKFVLINENDAFSRPGQLRFKYQDAGGDGVTILEGNIDSDEEVEFEIEIAGVREMRDHDFTWHS